MNTQDQNAAALLSEFDRPLAVLFISKNEDWQFRQKTQYEAIKGLMKPDFTSLDDFLSVMDQMMSAGSAGQKLGWTALKPSTKLQPKLMTKLIIDPVLGSVGKFMATLAGFTKLFATPLEILSDKAGFGARAGGM
jgi:hypothetical protein